MQIKYIQFFVMVLFTNVFLNTSGQPAFNMFDESADVGDVEIPGSFNYDENAQTYVIKGSGANIWFDNDEFHYAYKKVTGDFILRAQVKFLGNGVDPHRKTGWMIRNDISPDAAHASATVHGDGLTSLQFRFNTGEMMQERKSDINAPDVVQLTRSGSKIVMSTAHFGEPFQNHQEIDLPFQDEVYVGLFICSHNAEVTEKAKFSNVRVVFPAGADLVPYEDFLGSNLEIMDVTNGHRKIIYQHPQSIQAPNWRPDNSALIYNHDGLLFDFMLDTYKPIQINTGFATNNNNDHVLSFDGSKLGISHHSKEHDGKSLVYVLPSGGGQPMQVTSKGPSYLHGWSPDSKWLTYTGGRNDNYDIYKIPANGGKETRLTSADGLDDGSEYSPDGRYIYFNSNRTGTMQIWRMKPDGSEQKQITFDEYNDWFPHISPDGKWIVYLSYMPDVPSGSHPFYKNVYLRMMPVQGGKPNVIAYVYGGQGTMNVPSWSPDSKKIGFVSNTGSIPDKE
jgi:Tol biopolymer transport system component